MENKIYKLVVEYGNIFRKKINTVYVLPGVLGNKKLIAKKEISGVDIKNFVIKMNK